MNKKVAIIGSGPAGLTAGIYTSRASLDTTIFTGMQIGGQLTTTTEVENFPGFVDGIMGPELMANIQAQAEKFGAKMVIKEVKKIEKSEQGFLVDGDYFDAVIVASGASAKYLGLEGEKEWIGKGYHTCATCDGFFYRGKTVAVVGGGDSAMEEANFLTKFADKVYLIHRRAEFRASKIMIERTKNNPKVEILTPFGVTKFFGEKRIEKIELTNAENGQKSELKVDGLFVSIGHTPNSQPVKELLETDESGYLSTPSNTTMSKIEGLFIAGDVTDKIYRQAITSAGNGARAGIDCERWLESK